MDDRPIVRYLAVKPHLNHLGRLCGFLSPAILVTLEAALPLKETGSWWIVGLDPDDMHALAMFDRAHRQGGDPPNGEPIPPRD